MKYIVGTETRMSREAIANGAPPCQRLWLRLRRDENRVAVVYREYGPREDATPLDLVNARQYARMRKNTFIERAPS